MKDKICDCLFEEPCGFSRPLVIVIGNLLSVLCTLQFVILFFEMLCLENFFGLSQGALCARIKKRVLTGTAPHIAFKKNTIRDGGSTAL